MRLRVQPQLPIRLPPNSYGALALSNILKIHSKTSLGQTQLRSAAIKLTFKLSIQHSY